MSLAHRSTRRRMLLASDRADRSRELAAILQNAGDVEHTSTLNMPENPEGRFSGVVVDIDLTSIASMQVIRRKLIGKAYQALPPEEKRKLASRAARKPVPPPTAAAVRPVPKQKLAHLPHARKPDNGARVPVVPGQVDRHTLLPQPGALPQKP